jgi:hypothetical protein
MEVESAMALASVHEETEGLVQKIALLKGQLAKVHRACEAVEETTHGLFDVAGDTKQQWEESERGDRE